MFTIVGRFGGEIVTVNWVNGHVETPGNYVSEYIKWLATQQFAIPVYGTMPQVADKLSHPLSAYWTIWAALGGVIISESGDLPKIRIARPQPGIVV